MCKKLKEISGQNFDVTTLGAVLQEAFSSAGASTEIDGELAGKKIKYETRFDQSAPDFATRLANKYNAIFKAGGGRYLIVLRVSQKKFSGGSMGAVEVHMSECSDWSIESKPRPNYSKVAAICYDPAKGEPKLKV